MTTRFPLAPGFVVGAALIGFFDGIVFHQILGWHHMICIETHCIAKTVAVMKRQNFTDGLFHAAMWIVLIAGIVMLTRAVRTTSFSGRRFWGGALLGGGVFNVVEGIVDHLILQIHHVRFGPGQATWDGAFIAAGALLAIVGYVVVRQSPES
jgi:uncharacterized membrane protein